MSRKVLTSAILGGLLLTFTAVPIHSVMAQGVHHPEGWEDSDCIVTPNGIVTCEGTFPNVCVREQHAEWVTFGDRRVRRFVRKGWKCCVGCSVSLKEDTRWKRRLPAPGTSQSIRW